MNVFKKNAFKRKSTFKNKINAHKNKKVPLKN